MTKKIIIYLVGFIFVTFSLKSQDYHMSQYDVATMYLNPALTGVYGLENGDYRVYLGQRSQWKSVGVKPFLSSYLGYDMISKIKGRNLGLGGYIINNNGGIGNYNTLTFMTSASYNVLNAKARNKHILTVGLQMGLFYRSTNPNSLNYDVQYSLTNSGGAFDQAIPSNEVYNRSNITRFDANYGLYYKYLGVAKNVHPYIGLSMAHLTRPNESMTGGQNKLPVKWTVNGGTDIRINDKMDLNPRILFLNQAKASEFTAGFLFYYKINQNNTRVFGGFDYRIKDACFISLGLKHENYALRLSYDINTSYLKSYTKSRGAFEISLVYVGEKGKSFIKSVSSF